MAKRRRGRPGSRVTPPAQVWPDDEPGVPPIDAVAAALTDFEGIGDRSPLDIEVQVSSFLGELGAADVSTDDDEPDVEELLHGVVEVCLHHLDRSPPRVVLDFLWVLDAFDVPWMQLPLHERLEASTLPSRPAWAMDVGQAEIVGAHVIEHETGDGFDVAVVARHRSADADHVVAAYVDRTLGGIATDLLVHDDAEEYLRLSREAPGMRVEDLGLDTAARTIEAATDRTYEAGVPGAVAGGFSPLISIVEHYVAKLPEGGTPIADLAPPSAAEVEAVADRFLAGLEGMAHRRDRDVLVDVLGFVAGELGGDPLRWSPAVTQLVLGGWLPLSGYGDDVAERFPRLVRALLPWAHRERGWGDRYLDQAQDVVRAAEAGELAPEEGGRVDILEQAVAAGVDLDDEEALDAFLDRYLDDES